MRSVKKQQRIRLSLGVLGKGRRSVQSSVFQCSNLLSLQSQLNEDLLQFLVDKVDAELLEAIFLPGGGERNTAHTVHQIILAVNQSSLRPELSSTCSVFL